MKQAEVKYDTSAGSIHCDVKQSMCMPAVDFLRVLKATTMTTTVAIGYPVSYTNCAVPHTLTKAPERIIAMNQGVLEFMLGLGLGDKIIGSRPLDDAIWPKYKAVYDRIPSVYTNPNWWNYPDESTIMAEKADFIIGSWASSFRSAYTDDKGNPKGIFSSASVGPCVGALAEQHKDAITKNYRTCRHHLNKANIGTWLLSDACENTSIRADVTALGEEFTYKEMRDVGSLFKVDVEPLIAEMKTDFKLAQDLVSTANNMKPLTAVWVDCVWDCGKREEFYVGAGSGTPNMLMEKAGLTIVFKDKPGLWVYVNGSDIVKKNPDVIILVDWKRDPALETKITWLHGDKQFCEMDALKAARYITVPFSASGAGPRNGAAALDLATAALHVKQGLKISTRKSGISSFTPAILEAHLKTKTGMVCSMKKAEVKYNTSAGSIHCNVKQTACMPPVEQLRVLKALQTSMARATGVSFCFLVMVASLLQ
jgi:iron complex transport system substrate-binding protein